MSRCPQCQSTECPPALCRFSGMEHEKYLRIKTALNNYANAMTQRDLAARYEGRPDHDTDCRGKTLRPGR